MHRLIVCAFFIRPTGIDYHNQKIVPSQSQLQLTGYKLKLLSSFSVGLFFTIHKWEHQKSISPKFQGIEPLPFLNH